MKQSPTKLKDIAKELNISTSTVSKALKGSPQINLRTRQAVEEAAKRLNYQPNQIAQSLRSNKTNILGVVVPNLISHFFSASISGMQDVASSRGYNLIICQSNESYKKEVSAIQTLVSSRVDGLLISLSRETSSYSHIQALTAKGIPLVIFDRTCDGIEASKVTVDDYDGAFKATEHLLEGGYKKIAHISGPEHVSICKDRLKGYLDALHKWGITPREEYIYNSSLSHEDVVRKTKALLALPEPPDAIFTMNDHVATQAMALIKSRGMRVPQDIALVGFSNTPESALVEPSLTTVAQPAYQMGKIAASHILEQINNPDQFTPQTIVLKTDLIVRASSKQK